MCFNVILFLVLSEMELATRPVSVQAREALQVETVPLGEAIHYMIHGNISNL
jgi:hypothetical protein